MTTEPVQYRPLVAPGSACRLCSESDRLVLDHCHQHGWVRGVLCPSCNATVGYVDRRFSLNEKRLTSKGLTVADLLDHVARCPDCERPSFRDLSPRPGRSLPPALRRGVAVSWRESQVMVDAIDGHAERLELSRADAIRSLIRKGLEAEQKR